MNFKNIFRSLMPTKMFIISLIGILIVLIFTGVGAGLITFSAYWFLIQVFGQELGIHIGAVLGASFILTSLASIFGIFNKGK